MAVPRRPSRPPTAFCSRSRRRGSRRGVRGPRLSTRLGARAPSWTALRVIVVSYSSQHGAVRARGQGGTHVSTVDAELEITEAPVQSSDLEVTGAREARVGEMTVRRLLPLRLRRTVGAWCFVDHYGPMSVDGVAGMRVPPHPHIGLQTVTWLLSGNVLHRDSLGSEQMIRPGQLNLMTAGRGRRASGEAAGAAG